MADARDQSLLCAGRFIGLWTVIYLIADLHRGFASYWWLIAILVVDVVANVALRVIRDRRRARDPDAMCTAVRRAALATPAYRSGATPAIGAGPDGPERLRMTPLIGLTPTPSTGSPGRGLRQIGGAELATAAEQTLAGRL